MRASAEIDPKGILVVEDDDDIRETIREVLSDEGYHVHTAPNGRAGLDWLHDQDHHPRPNLILLDLMMPVMNGFEFLQALRQDAALKGIPVVVVSAWGDEARDAGANCFIAKPVDLSKLV